MRKYLIVLALFPAMALAQVDATCDQPRDLDKYQLLRRLSIDLRGKVPSYAEYTSLDSQTSVPPSTVKSWLTTDDFRAVMRDYHEKLFWPNVSNVLLNNVNAQLVAVPGFGANAIFSVAKRRQFRGSTDVSTAAWGAQCGDFEQTQFTAGFVPVDSAVKKSIVGGVEVRQEGWRMVTPFWSTTPIKVCAFDAMETERVTVAAKTIECNTIEGDTRKECGCGPNLRFCYGPPGVVRSVILSAMREQLNLMVDRVSMGGQAYTELINSRSAPVNGPLVFWKKYLAPHLPSNYSRPVAYADPNEPLDNANFSDPTWRLVDRGSDLHAGVLTSPAYLLRFQTNRGRANRFRNDFECEAFVPPADIETPAVDGCSDTTGDITQRCTCRYCHRQLEPLAAHWGQFAEAGTTLLSDLTFFPRMKASCKDSSSDFCRRFYVTDPAADNAGSLLPYQYADAAHADITAALANGPSGRANAIIADGTFARCAVKRSWAYFMKRDMRVAGSDTSELATLETLATDFKNNGYKLPWLIEQIVSQPSYRRVR